MFAVLTQSSSMPELKNLLNSIENNWVIKPDIYLMNFTDEDICCKNLKIFQIREKKQIPLSVARNTLIKEFSLIGDSRYSHFVFLDDDCWFVDQFDSSILEPDSNYIGIARSPQGQLLHSVDINQFNCAISINLIVTSRNLIYFNEKLGLGAPIAAGEDWDYFQEVSKLQKFKLTKKYLVTHEAFREKITRLTYCQLKEKAKSEALAVRYVSTKHNIRVGNFVAKSILKGLFPFWGLRFMVKNLYFVYYYVY